MYGNNNGESITAGGDGDLIDLGSKLTMECGNNTLVATGSFDTILGGYGDNLITITGNGNSYTGQSGGVSTDIISISGASNTVYGGDAAYKIIVDASSLQNVLFLGNGGGSLDDSADKEIILCGTGSDSIALHMAPPAKDQPVADPKGDGFSLPVTEDHQLLAHNIVIGMFSVKADQLVLDGNASDYQLGSFIAATDDTPNEQVIHSAAGDITLLALTGELTMDQIRFTGADKVEA